MLYQPRLWTMKDTATNAVKLAPGAVVSGKRPHVAGDGFHHDPTTVSPSTTTSAAIVVQRQRQQDEHQQERKRPTKQQRQDDVEEGDWSESGSEAPHALHDQLHEKEEPPKCVTPPLVWIHHDPTGSLSRPHSPTATTSSCNLRRSDDEEDAWTTSTTESSSSSSMDISEADRQASLLLVSLARQTLSPRDVLDTATVLTEPARVTPLSSDVSSTSEGSAFFPRSVPSPKAQNQSSSIENASDPISTDSSFTEGVLPPSLPTSSSTEQAAKEQPLKKRKHLRLKEDKDVFKAVIPEVASSNVQVKKSLRPKKRRMQVEDDDDDDDDYEPDVTTSKKQPPAKRSKSTVTRKASSLTTEKKTPAATVSKSQRPTSRAESPALKLAEVDLGTGNNSRRKTPDFLLGIDPYKIEPFIPPITIKGDLNADQLNPNDVLMGRGNAIANYPGNQQYRHIIRHYKPAYVNSFRYEKRLIAQQVVNCVTNLGGRFLEEVPGSAAAGRMATNTVYRQIRVERALEKIAQACREKMM